MVIPKGVNYIEFYKAARAKGVKLSSRYNGVVIGNNGNREIAFRAQKMVNGKMLYLGLFPLTEEGELRASQCYERYEKGATV